MFIPLMMAFALGVPGEEKPGDVKILGRGNWKSPATQGAPATQLVIRNGNEYARAVRTRESPAAALANLRKEMKVDVDWDKHMLIVVTAGVQPTGGYRVEITDVTKGDDTMTVRWKLHKPKPGDLTTSALTHPAEMVLVEKFAGTVVFDPPAGK
jgi:hypothetical protein